MAANLKSVARVEGGIQQAEPHSIEAEQALLGALMLDNGLLDETDSILLPGHFYVPFHEQLYATIQELVGKGWAASPLTLRDSFRERSTFEKDGDLIEHLTQLAENASLATDISVLAQIIHNHHQQRSLLGVARQLTTEAASQLTPEDTQRVIADAEASLFELGDLGVRRDSLDFKATVKSVVDDIYRADDGRLVGVTSGIPMLDELLGGFEPSDLIILAGRPAMGKTSLALNLAVNAANALEREEEGGAAVGVFSLEMAGRQLVERVLAGAGDVDGNLMRRGKLRERDKGRLTSAASRVAKLQLTIDDTPSLHIATMRSRARRMVRKHNVGLIIVDYIQLMRGTRGVASGNRVQEVSEISEGLKSIARELNVPVIALSQLSRGVENRDNKRPRLADLRESGSIEQDADVVMFVYREAYYLENEFGPESGWTPEQRERMKQVRFAAELIVAKQRKGPTGSVGLTFNPSATTFKSAA